VTRRILVSSNCQTGSIAAGMQALFPADAVAAVAMPESAVAVTEFAGHLAATDVWVGHFDLVERPELAAAFVGKQIIKIPHIAFDAFHPDMCYARIAPTDSLVTPHYNSRLVVWSYRHRIEPDDAIRLFDEEVFARLGYFDRWDAAVRHLRWLLEFCGLEFDRFFLRIKRTGNFMYSQNHPRGHVLTALAKLAALKMGEPDSILDVEIDVVDALADLDIWPVYPYVGERLGVPTSYRWRRSGRIYGLRELIEDSYATYARLDIDPDALSMDRIGTFIDDATMDRVLAEHRWR
jgi:Polysaccharide biosynthesis enzyme WcbI